MGPNAARDLMADPAFFAPRRCMREPIAEIWEAASFLGEAVTAHLAGDGTRAASAVRRADMGIVREWVESLWGSRKANPDQWMYHRFRKVDGASPHLPPEQRVKVRMPTSDQRRTLIERYGHHCAFCGIPLIRVEVRSALTAVYPDAAYWGTTNATQHGAFQCLWLQYDHLLPHSRGGDNSLENVVIACAGCNFGRMSWTLEEVGLLDPRARPRTQSSWDGLERLLL